MKKIYSIVVLFLCTLCFSFLNYYFSSSLGVPTVEDVYGGRINYISGYSFHSDSTRVFVSTESANSVFYADVLSNSGSPILGAFKVVPSLDDTQDFGSAIKKIMVHETSESFYFMKVMVSEEFAKLLQ